MKPFTENKPEDKQLSSVVLKRENMVIYLLINETEKVSEKLKEVITPEEFKDELNKQILKKLYEELENGNINTNQLLDKLEDENMINHMTEIMAYDFEITDVDKAVEDIVTIYEKEKLLQKRNQLLKQIEENNDDVEKVRQLEEELNSIILKLAKMK